MYVKSLLSQHQHVILKQVNEWDYFIFHPVTYIPTRLSHVLYHIL